MSGGIARAYVPERPVPPPVDRAPASMTNLMALPPGTVLAGDYRIGRVLGAGGFGITYLAEELSLARLVAIKEYFPVDFAARDGDLAAQPRSEECRSDYQWGLDRFLDEARTLALFDHPNIVRVHRYFKDRNAGFIVLSYEDGQSLKAWLKSLGRAPRQMEIDQLLAPLLDALEIVHAADYLHRDIAPDNIIIRPDRSPVLIDFGSARTDIAQHSRTVSALVKPGYSPFEQYATTSRQQGPWSDIYSLAATLYQAVTGKRPPDAPSRMVEDDLVPSRDAALSAYRPGFLAAIDSALVLDVTARPRSIGDWRKALFAENARGEVARAGKSAAAVAGAGEPRPSSEAVDPTPAEPVVPAAPAQAQAVEVADVSAASSPGRPTISRPRAPLRLAERLAGLLGTRRPSPDHAGAASIAAGEGSPGVKSAAPSASEPAAKRAPPRPTHARPRRSWRPLAMKAAIGVAIAGLAVSLQDFLPGPAPATKGRGTVTSARLPGAQVGEIKGHRGGVGGVSYSADGRSILTLGDDGALKTWRADRLTETATYALERPRASVLATSGQRAAAAHRDGRIEVWDIERATRIVQLKRNDAEVWALAMVDDGRRLVAAAHDWKVAVYDLTTPDAEPRLLEGHTSAVKALAVGPDGDLLATGGADRTVRMWSLADGAGKGIYRGHQDFVMALAYAPDGRRIASGDLSGEVRIWSPRGRRTQRVLKAHRGAVTALAYSPDGRQLASAGHDGVVKLWDIARTRASRSLIGHAGDVRSLSFSPDSRRLASSGADGVVRIWTTARSVPSRE